jgi:hypothetical protein
MSPMSPARLPTYLLLGLLLTLVLPALAKVEFRVDQARSRLENGVYYLDATIAYDFSKEALEALDHGVPLTIVTHLQVRRVGAWLWEDSLQDLQLRSVIRYKPLSERYEIYRLPDTSGQGFVSREAALKALSEIAGLALVDADRLEADEAYEVQIKVRLDIEELPLPLRPIAYLKPSWKLSSGWSKWPLNP